MAVVFEKLEIDSVESINNLDTLELVNWVDAMLKEAGRSGSASNLPDVNDQAAGANPSKPR